MKLNRHILALCAVQIAIVSTIAAKYLYERHFCPRVWVQVSQFDPDTVMRGRYFALQPVVDACSLDKKLAEHMNPETRGDWHVDESWEWTVKLLPRDGTLIPVISGLEDDDVYRLRLYAGQPCQTARTNQTIEFYVAEHSKSPFPLPSGSEAWLSATIPPTGPPRAVQLAIKQNGVLTPLKLN
jgi:hypothetical protein